MKKVIGILLFVALCLSLFSCQNIEELPTTTSPKTTDPNTETETKVGDVTNPNPVPQVGRKHSAGINYQSYAFFSYEELLVHFSSEATPENSVIHAEKAEWSEDHQALLDSLKAEDILLPHIDGQRVPVQMLDQIERISYLTADTLCMPAFFYHLEHEEYGYFFVQVYYPSLLPGYSFAESQSASEVLTVLSPAYPNIDNWNTLYSSYDYMVLRNIQLKDQTVSALVYKTSSGEEHYVWIHYRGMLIRFRGTEELINNAEFWSRFSME